jgi:hypothetical protein
MFFGKQSHQSNKNHTTYERSNKVWRKEERREREKEGGGEGEGEGEGVEKEPERNMLGHVRLAEGSLKQQLLELWNARATERTAEVAHGHNIFILRVSPLQIRHRLLQLLFLFGSGKE